MDNKELDYLAAKVADYLRTPRIFLPSGQSFSDCPGHYQQTGFPSAVLFIRRQKQALEIH